MQHPEVLSDVSRETLVKFQDFVLKWNQKINLISPASQDEIWSRHILNSVALDRHIPNGIPIVDLGSGAGFPGIILGLLDLSRSIHLVESDARKAAFLQEACRNFNIQATVHNKRVEALPDLNAVQFTSRGFAAVSKTLDLTQHLHRRSTRFTMLKGKRVDDELKVAETRWKFRATKHEMPTHSDGWILELSDIKEV